MSRISVRGLAVASATAVTAVGAVTGVASGQTGTPHDAEALVGDTTHGPGHLKLTIEDDHSTTRSAIGFGLGDREVTIGARVDLAFVPKVSTWQGRRNAELELSDLAVLDA